MTVGLWYNENKAGILPIAARVVAAIERAGATPVMSDRLSAALRRAPGSRDFGGCAFLCVLGGDGTLLAALEAALPYDLPLLGVNMGRVGYMSEVQPENIERDLPLAIAGAGVVERRMLLEAETPDGRRYLALNDISFNRADGSIGVLPLEMTARDTVIDRLAGDGLVVATATGSTAYSLSAGGPIIAPGFDCILLTPVCSHTLHARPVVLSPDETVCVRVMEDPSRARVYADGRVAIELSPEQPTLRIRRARETAAFLRLHRRDFFGVLRGKLTSWDVQG